MAKRAPITEPDSDVQIPDAVPGGTGYSESLGKFVDNLLGAERMHKRAVQRTAAEFPRMAVQPIDPPPAELPPAVRDGTEYSTRAARRRAKKREAKKR